MLVPFSVIATWHLLERALPGARAGYATSALPVMATISHQLTTPAFRKLAAPATVIQAAFLNAINAMIKEQLN